jgi:hypothetical protein
MCREVNMSKTDGTPKTFSEAEIREGLQKLADLYEHDYKSKMPDLLTPKAFAGGLEAERIGRLFGVVLKSPVAKGEKIDSADSNTGSHFAYKFDLAKLEAPAFAASIHGKIYEALLEQTKDMTDQGAESDLGYVLNSIYSLPPGQREAKFAEELSSEGRTFRKFLEAYQFLVCKTEVRTALLAVVGAQVGTPATAATVASFLAAKIIWIGLFPPAMVTAVAGLIIVLGVQGFCSWGKKYLEENKKTEDFTGAGKVSG